MPQTLPTKIGIEELKKLEQLYGLDNAPSKHQKVALAIQLNLDKHAIYEWFMKSNMGIGRVYSHKLRPVLTEPHIEELERLYVRCHYPNHLQLRDLSSILNLEEAVAVTWFRQRNAIERKLGNKAASDKYRPKVETTQCLGENDENQQGQNKLDWEKIAKLKEFFEKRIYPNQEEKRQMCAENGVDMYTLEMWFSTARRTVKIRSLKPEQVEKLEEMYKVNKCPTRSQKKEMCNAIGLNLTTFKSWYQIRRQNLETHNNINDVSLANINDEQLGMLEHCYQRNVYPSENDMKSLSKAMGMAYSIAEKWFAMRRTNDMKAETTFSSDQLQKMNEFFAKYVCPCDDETIKLCREEELDFKVVKRWLRSEKIMLSLNKNCCRNGSLEKLYSICKFPTKEQKMELCNELHTSYTFISLWFNRRRKADTSCDQKDQGPSNTLRLFTEDQLSKMEDMYRKCKHPSRQQIDDLATELGIDRKKIYTWMERRRKKGQKLVGVDSQRSISSCNSLAICKNQLLNDGNLESDLEDRSDTSCDDDEVVNDDVIPRIPMKRFKLEKMAIASSAELARKIRNQKFEELYSICKYPTSEQKMELSKEFNRSLKTIEAWFYNRRKADTSCHLKDKGPFSTLRLLTEDQLLKMEDIYRKCKHPSRKQIDELATELDIDRNKIYTWMVRRRVKERKLLGVDNQRNVSSGNFETDPEEGFDTSTCDDEDDDNDGTIE